MRADRPWHDPKYKKWRMAVFRRDGFKCRQCGLKDRIEAHHIKKWASFPLLRYVVGNGITLCKLHHDAVWGKEEQWEATFMALLPNSGTAAILWMLNNAQQEEGA